MLIVPTSALSGHRRCFQRLLLATYAIVTAFGIIAAFTHWIPQVPVLHEAVFFAYAMAAPYQGDDAWNGALRAEGLRGDQWSTIDLLPYFPQQFGEANARMFLRTFRTPESRNAAAMSFALQLKDREALHSRRYDAVRLIWERWPRSPEGFDALRHAPFFIEQRVVAHVQE